MIKTVTGFYKRPLSGIFHSHEHIYIDGDKLGENCPVLPIDDYALSCAELRSFYADGGKCIADAQPVSAGGRPDLLKKLSLNSKVKIIASTGFHKLCFYKPDSFILNCSDADYIADTFINDVENGLCGVIKTAADSCGISGRYEILHSAAAISALKTGYPIICHIEKGASISQVTKFYLDKGLPGNQIILCHADRAVPDIAEHIDAAKLGCYLEYDTIARPKYHSDLEEISIISQVCNKGCVSNVLLGLDTTRQRLVSYSGVSAPGLVYIIEAFVPRLLNSGFTGREIDMFTRLNPFAAFSKH